MYVCTSSNRLVEQNSVRIPIFQSIPPVYLKLQVTRCISSVLHFTNANTKHIPDSTDFRLTPNALRWRRLHWINRGMPLSPSLTRRPAWVECTGAGRNYWPRLWSHSTKAYSGMSRISPQSAYEKPINHKNINLCYSSVSTRSTLNFGRFKLRVGRVFVVCFVRSSLCDEPSSS